MQLIRSRLLPFFGLSRSAEAQDNFFASHCMDAMRGKTEATMSKWLSLIWSSKSQSRHEWHARSARSLTIQIATKSGRTGFELLTTQSVMPTSFSRVQILVDKYTSSIGLPCAKTAASIKDRSSINWRKNQRAKQTIFSDCQPLGVFVTSSWHSSNLSQRS